MSGNEKGSLDPLSDKMFKLLASRSSSGLSVKQFCKEHGLSVPRYSYWQKKYKARCNDLSQKGGESTVLNATILHEILRNEAKERRVIGYKPLLALYNNQLSGDPITMKQLEELLIELGTGCFANGEPPLNSIVISQAKYKPPAPLFGFYVWLWKQYKIYLPKENLSREAKIQIHEIFAKQCFHYWAMKKNGARSNKK